MTLSDPTPLADAVARMNAKTPIAQAMTSAEWADVPLALRERSFWTARFAKADVLQLMHDKIGTALELGSEKVAHGDRLVSRSSFVRDMRKALQDSGYIPEPGREGTLRDHTSRGRLGLIYDFNTTQAQEFARWKTGQADGALDAFPCQELYREEGRMVPRDWRKRWVENGGELFNGRMIARKDSPIWSAISRFKTPFPPYDYSSGMGIRDVSREESISLGVIAVGTKQEMPQVGFNDMLQKSVERYAPPIRTAILKDLGNRAVVEQGVAKWIGEQPPVVQAPAEMHVSEARAALEKGFEVEDADGDVVKFGSRALEYFDKADGAKDDRLKYLAWAEQAVRTGKKTMLGDRAVYTQAFLSKAGAPKGILTLVSLPDGEVFNFYRKPVRKLMSTKPDGSTRSALKKVKSLPTPSPADPNVKPGGGEVKP